MRQPDWRWWEKAVRKNGGKYDAIYMHRAATFKYWGSDIDIPACELIVFTRSATNRDWMFMRKLHDHGGADCSIWLAKPHLVLNYAAMTWGLLCRLCGTAAPTQHFEPSFVCKGCGGEARSEMQVQTALLRLNREIARRQRVTVKVFA